MRKILYEVSFPPMDGFSFAVRVLVVCSCFFSPVFGLHPRVQSRHAVVVNADTGEVLYQKNGYARIFPASTTKLAVVLYILDTFPDQIDMDVYCAEELLTKVTHQKKRSVNYALPPHWLQPDGTNIGIKAGEVLSVRMLLYAMMLVSANDAANVLAHHFGQNSISQFMEELNKYLLSLGCRHTHFNNPHGLHHPGHYSTPYDMALIGKHAASCQKLREIMLTDAHWRTGTAKEKPFLMQQKNLLVKEGTYYYPHAYGMKTGYTTPAGFNLVTAASNGQRNVVIALHQAEKMEYCYRDAIRIFEECFKEPTEQRLLFAQEDTIFQHKVHSQTLLRAGLQEDVAIQYYPSEPPVIATELHWKQIRLPVMKETVVGELLVSDTHGVLVRTPLFAMDTLYIRGGSLYWWVSICLVAIGFILFICSLLWFKHRHKKKPVSLEQRVVRDDKKGQTIG